MKPQLSLRDGLLALAVVFVWGTNFVVIRLGLNVLPPLFFATLRFFFVLAPACLLLRRPKVSWANLIFYGIAIGAGQFGLLFIAMNGRIRRASPRWWCRCRSSSPSGWLCGARANG